MAILGDITIDWDSSPRIVMVDKPSTEITMQDLYDTLRDAEIVQVDENYIVSGAGKEPLGAGVVVGLTLTLNNALVGFEARTGPAYIQCRISGGNLVANDSAGDPVDSSIYPTAFTQIVQANSSSATLQESSAIEYASFNGGVSIDVINGYPGEGGPGNPIGNIQYPSDNIPDALAIAITRGFTNFFLVSSLTINGGSDFAGMSIAGNSHLHTLVTIEDSAIVDDINLFNCNITGVMDGGIDITFCVIETLTYMHGHVHDSALNGTIILGGTEDAWIGNCSQLDPINVPIINMGGTGQDLMMPNYAGDIKIINLTGSSKAKIGLLYGTVILDTATVTSGIVEVGGTGYLKDELGNPIVTGVWNGVTIINGLVNNKTVANAVWDETLANHGNTGSVGKTIDDIFNSTDKKLLTKALWQALK